MHPRSSGIEGVNPDEKILATVSRHSFGLILMYIEVAVGLIAAAGLLYFLLPGFFADTSTAATFAGVGILLVSILAVLILIVGTQIYYQSRLIITDKNITQVLQRGLFSRQVSELSMANVEDVTADQHGILAHMFGYGVLRIETAGEQNNFRFTYCPKPNYYGRMILDARQRYLHPPHSDPAAPPAPPQH